MEMTTKAVLGAEMPWLTATHMVCTAAQPAINEVSPSPTPAAIALRFNGALFFRSFLAKSSVACPLIPLAAISAADINSLEVVATPDVRWSANAVPVRASMARTSNGTKINAALPATAAGHQTPAAKKYTMPAAVDNVRTAAGIDKITRVTASRN